MEDGITRAWKDAGLSSPDLTGRTGLPRESIAELVNELRRGAGLEGLEACRALTKVGPAAIPLIETVLSDRDKGVRWRAAHCLAAMQCPEALSGLLHAFHDDSPDVAWIAANGLIALGPNVSADVLRSVLRHRITFVTIYALRHYAENALPRRIFRPIIAATHGLGVISATLVAVSRALDALSAESLLEEGSSGD